MAEVRSEVLSLSIDRAAQQPQGMAERNLWLVQRKRALDMCCSCVEDAFQAKDGPALQHATYFRAFAFKALKKALCLKGDLP